MSGGGRSEALGFGGGVALVLWQIGRTATLSALPSTAVGVIYKSFLAVLWDFATVSFSFCAGRTHAGIRGLPGGAWPVAVCVCVCAMEMDMEGGSHNAAIRSCRQALANAKR